MFILDTNVVSELRRRDRANRSVLDWADRIAPADMWISAVTLMELRIGALLLERRDDRQGRALHLWIEQTVVPMFDRRTLAFDAAVAAYCAKLHVPNRRPERDAFIAATALAHDFTVVTRNIRDFADTGVRLVNPWDAA